MSETYNIACHDCAISLWIGQCRTGGDLSRAYLYTTERAQQLQRDFFFAHIHHRLEFNTSEHFAATYDYREIPYDDESPS
jgi:hypothetical protein